MRDHLSAIFYALSDPTRRAIVAKLALGEASVTELAEPFEMSARAVSKHVSVLEESGLITRSRDAQRRLSHLELAPLKQVDEWLDRYRNLLDGRLDRLGALLDEMNKGART